MGILIGNQELKGLKLGTLDVHEVYLGNYLIWPLDTEEQLDLEALKLALSCISLGIWIDVLPWNDNTPWVD